jgi:hypothetical protein
VSQTVLAYADTFEHLDDELARLDLLIALRSDELAYELAEARDPEAQLARIMAVSRDEVDRLLRPSPQPPPREPVSGRTAVAAAGGRIARRVAASLVAGIPLGLPRLARALSLDEFETQAVVVCLAPELRRRYDRLYAYLQDDISRKRPSVDLILDLLCVGERERWRARSRFDEGAPLLRHGVLEVVPDPYSPSGSTGLARFLRLDQRVLAFVLGDDDLDPRLAGSARLCPPAEGPGPSPAEAVADDDTLTMLVRLLRAPSDPAGRRARPAVVHLQGPDNGGLRRLALRAVASLGVVALVADAGFLRGEVAGAPGAPADGRDPVRWVGMLFGEARLHGAVVVLTGIDALLPDDARRTRTALSQALADRAEMMVTTGERAWGERDWPDSVRVSSVAIPAADRRRRTSAWKRHLDHRFPEGSGWAELLADRYELGTDRIDDAAHAADDLAVMDGRPLVLDDLLVACREQSRRRTSGLAVRLEPRYGWADLVLPANRITLLRELCDQVRYRHVVYEGWGFARRVARGAGVSALFTGPPGTGKTLAAEVVAADLGLDLQSVDLSQVTSKYIGETEKNLAAVFDEAQGGNSVLFFDEADALFGRRTDISDAHDRYANLEVSYLLQRMEEYRGVVVLATNLRQNLDEAFTRRIRFLVDFPFPDEAHRRRIWLSHLPAEAPLAPDVDVDELARTYPMAGGNIKNVALAAAFLAAAAGGTIRAEHLLLGTRREFDKVGKVWPEALSGATASGGAR